MLNDWASWATIVSALLPIAAGAGYAFSRYLTKGIAAEFKPNGGSSLKDAVTRIEQKVDALDGKLGQHLIESAGHVASHAARIEALERR